MADRNRYDYYGRRRPERGEGEEFSNRVRDRFTGEARDREDDRDWNRGRDWDTNRDWGRSRYGGRGQNWEDSPDWNRTRQWRSDQDYGYGRYGQNYDRGWYEDDWDMTNYGERGRANQAYTRDRGYGRSYDRSTYNRDFGMEEDYDDYRGYDAGYGPSRYSNYGAGYNRGRGRTYGRGGMQSDYESPGSQYGTAGMRSDYGQDYRYEDDYGYNRGYNRGYGRGYGRDRWGRSTGEDYSQGYVGYDREGAFYQDLDEPYSYEYWEFWTIPGEFTGIGPEDYQRPDERIYEDVCERLTRHGRIDASNIELEVKNGEIFLRGSVPSREMKRLAEDTAESVFGVSDVHNEIRVQQRQQGTGWQPKTGWKQETGRMQEVESGEMSGERNRQATAGATAGMTGTAASMGDQPRRQLREGMEVIGKNGKVVGRVKEIRGNDFLVDRDMARDVYVPFHAVKSVGAQALLDVTAEEVENQNWEMPDIL